MFGCFCGLCSPHQMMAERHDFLSCVLGNEQLRVRALTISRAATSMPGSPNTRPWKLASPTGHPGHAVVAMARGSAVCSSCRQRLHTRAARCMLCTECGRRGLRISPRIKIDAPLERQTCGAESCDMPSPTLLQRTSPNEGETGLEKRTFHCNTPPAAHLGLLPSSKTKRPRSRIYWEAHPNRKKTWVLASIVSRAARDCRFQRSVSSQCRGPAAAEGRFQTGGSDRRAL